MSDCHHKRFIYSSLGPFFFPITQRLCLRQNLISKIEGLSEIVTLNELDLYDNRISSIENLESLVDLE